ncbi:MAG: FAD-binding oxidoreductase [Ignavibacteria bacterium]|nr:FAD-binding oxidoreductase [Ignavibacteria bacterium]
MLSIWEKNSFINFDIIIIGSGILGLSTAISIKEIDPDKDVLILERGTLPSGASTKNAGFACFGSLTEIIADCGRVGESATAELVEKRWKGIGMLRHRLGDEAIGLLNYGGYELIAGSHLHCTDKIDAVNRLLKSIFSDDAFSKADSFIDKFGFSRNFAKSLVFSKYESQIDTGKMMRSLLKKAQSLGVVIVNNFDAIIEDAASDRLTVASKTSPVRFTSTAIISCSNAFTSFILPGIDIRPGRGQVVATSPVRGLRFKGVFHIEEGYYYFRNFGDRVILGGGRNLDFKSEETHSFGNTGKVLDKLNSLLREVIIPGEEFEIECAWSGIMGFNESKLPLVAEAGENIFAGFCCNGMGVALASYTGKELAETALKNF